jgi:phospholipid transport system transporter-binding protein
MNSAQLTRESDGSYRVVGALLFDNVRDVLKQSTETFAAANELSIDLSGVTNADSAGLALLIEWYRMAERDRRKLRFVGAPQQIRALAKISDLDTLLPFA